MIVMLGGCVGMKMREFFFSFLTTLTFNFPMAFFVQIFLLGPLLKRLILDNQKGKGENNDS